jgi:flagellar motor switch protein FliM
MDAGGSHPDARRKGQDFAREFSAAAGGLLRTPVQVRLVASAPVSAKDFAASVEEPSCLYRLVGPNPAAASDAEAFAELAPPIAFALVDRLFGGTGTGEPSAERPLTSMERKALARVMDLVSTCLHKACGETSALGVTGDASGECMDRLSRDDRPHLCLTVELCLDGRAGTLRICGCPVSASAAKEPSATRPAASQGPLELTVSPPEVYLAEEELAGLAAGDIVETETPVDGEVIVRVAGIPKFAARLGISEGKRCITILRRLDTPKKDA